MLTTHKITRVHELAREASVASATALSVIKTLGYPVRSSSSRLVDLLPIEREALTATITDVTFMRVTR